MDVHFYEAFEEEIVMLRQYLPAHVRAHFTSNTIQEAGDEEHDDYKYARAAPNPQADSV